MANITTSGTTGYPSAIDTRTALTDGATGDLIVANHPNGLGAAVLAVETALGVTPQGTATDVVTRLGVSQNADGTIRSTVVAQGTGAAVTYSTGVFTVSFSGDGPSFAQNYGLEVAINTPVANQMTIRLRQSDGVSTPTTANPSRFAVRSAATLTSGTYTLVNATQSTTLVLTGGSTLGMVANEIGRLYVGIVVSNSVPELCIWNPKSWISSPAGNYLAQLFRPDENYFVTTVAEGGAGGADNMATLYTTTARSSVPIRIIGYMDIQVGAVAGNWSNAPLALQLVGPQTKITGDIVQSFATITSTQTSVTTTAVYDDTFPLISEGVAVLVATMTGVSQVNPIHVSAIANASARAAPSNIVMHLHRNSEGNAVAAFITRIPSSDDPFHLNFDCLLATNSGGTTGYYLLVGTTAGQLIFNGGPTGNHLFGGASIAKLLVEEISA